MSNSNCHADADEAWLALASAIKSDDIASARQILAAHPGIRQRLNEAMPGGAFGATPLLTAVHRDCRQMVDLLLDAGADINAKSHWWAGPFGVLDHKGSLCDYLIQRGARVDSYVAARWGMLDRLKQIVAADPAAVNLRGGDGQTPLHVAGSVEIAQFLLEHGADINARDIDHESTAAQYLVRSHPHVARFLVERGCESDILLLAALGDYGGVKRMLDAEASLVRMSVTAENFPMKNPRAGGCIYFWTLGRHKSIHEIAREFGHDDVLQLLLDRSPDDLKLQLACQIGDEPSFNALLAQNPNLAKTLSEADRQKLPNAAQASNAHAVRLMLKAGWPVGARGQHSATALHWAAWHGNAQIVREILAFNPQIDDAGNEYRSTPLAWAIHGSENSWHRQAGDYRLTVELLCERGATIPVEIRGSAIVRETLARLSQPRHPR